MLTIRRILKHTPIVIVAILLLVWVASINRAINYCFVGRSGETNLQLSCGSLRLLQFGTVLSEPGLEVWTCVNWGDMSAREVSGEYSYESVSLNDPFFDQEKVEIPLAWLASAILPLAVGSWTAFRFRLWHYFAYTALVGVELVYYLRWQA